MIVDEDEVRDRLAQLDRDMTAAGRLRSPRWRDALHAVHRHVFVPRFWVDDDPGSDPPRWRMVDSATADHHEWFDGVYSDRSLPTELLGVPRPDGGGVHPLVTSSTTMPSLVLAMLEGLDVPDATDAVHVLEVGTATGYNAGLLCHRFGDQNVTTIEVAPELAALARLRLADHGYRPCVVAGDGAGGVPDRAPFDRIIATCGLDHLPPAWLAQTRPGGKIMVNLLGPFSRYTLLLLDVLDDHGAAGRVLEQTGSFMPRRTDPTLPFDQRVPISRPAAAVHTSTTPLDPTQLYRDDTWGLLVQLRQPDLVSRQVYITDPDHDDPDGTGALGTELATRDGTSWAQVHHDADQHGTFTVTHAGPRRLWAEIEDLHREWETVGQPDTRHWDVTVDPAGEIALQFTGPSGSPDDAHGHGGGRNLGGRRSRNAVVPSWNSAVP